MKFLRTNEAAAYLGVAPRTLRVLWRDRVRPTSKIGGGILFYRVTDLDAFVESHRVDA
jgi:excisionase family DNA binding protein